MKSYNIPTLPLGFDIESKLILKQLAKARAALANLNGVCSGIPSQGILINLLSLQEAKDSSAIENIITTQDDLYRCDVFAKQFASFDAKEVYNYVHALRGGFEEVKKTGVITINNILQIQSILEENHAGFRKLPGTTLKNAQTGEIVYTPPQDHQMIVGFMSNLLLFMNDDSICDWDPLIKMAVIHHQFESIHPFYDGNGRTGRIINILYLVQQGLLNMPVIYLSRYINQNKADYYRLLQVVRSENGWCDWVMYILQAVEQTAQQTTKLVENIRDLMLSHKHKIRSERPKIYTQDLLNIIFSHPYSRIDFLVRELGVTRVTATRYLDELQAIGLMSKLKIEGSSYYVNNKLFELFQHAQDL